MAYSKEKQKEYGRQHYLKYKDKYKAKTYDWKNKNPEKWKERAFKNKLSTRYGISVEFYEDRLKVQHNRCAICLNHCKTRKKLSIDHCHATGKFRGLICNSCNLGLANFNDDPGLLQAAARYIVEN